MRILLTGWGAIAVCLGIRIGMRSTDMKDLGGVAAEGLTVLNGFVRGMHTGIAGRVFSSIGPAARPVEVVHDTVTGMVYGGLDAAGRRLPPALGSLAASNAALDDDPPLDTSIPAPRSSSRRSMESTATRFPPGATGWPPRWRYGWRGAPSR